MHVLIVLLCLSLAHGVCAQAPASPAPASKAAEADPDAELKAAARAMDAAHKRADPAPTPDDAVAATTPYARHRIAKGLLAGGLAVAFSVPVALVSVDLAAPLGWLLLPVPMLASAAGVTIMGSNYGSPATFGSAFGGAALAGALGYGIGVAASSAEGLDDNQTARMVLLIGCTGIFTGLGATAAHSAAEDRAFAKRSVQVGLAPSRGGLLMAVSGRF